MKASAESIECLNEAASAVLSLHTDVQRHLKGLKGIEGFCRERLRTALAAQFSHGLDVDKDRLWLPQTDRVAIGPPFYRDLTTHSYWVSHTLLEAAMQNFTAAEEQVGDDGMPAQARLESATALLQPTAFARCCRALDLGRLYQEHLLQVFDIEAPASAVDESPVALAIKKLRGAAFKLDIWVAFLKQHISRAALDMLQLFQARGATTKHSDIMYGNRPVIIQGLEAHTACLWGAVVFSTRSIEEFSNEKCIVYMPGDAQRCVYEYALFSDFQEHIEEQLKAPLYAQAFTRYIDEASRLDFFKAVSDNAGLGRIKQRLINTDLMSFYWQSLVGKLQLDSRILAVPTEDVDAEERQKRLDGYWEAGLTLANIGALFIPVLGELMMGVAIGQLVGEVYDGVEDWRAGDKQQALSHLTNVVTNVAMLAVFAAGNAALKVRAGQSSSAAFFDDFEAVENTGQRRLWKRSLKAYRQSVDISVKADADGIYREGGKTYLKLDDDVLAVNLDQASNTWRIMHPTDPKAFTPAVALNGDGGWRYIAERPSEWENASYALMRLAPDLVNVGNNRLAAVQEITHSPLSRLQQWGLQDRPVSPRFRDQAQRFMLEQRIRDCIWHLENEGQPTADNQVLLLHALPALPQWPKHSFFELFDAQGNLIDSYPQGLTVTAEHRAIRLSEHQLRYEGAMGIALEGIGPQEREQLLSGTPDAATPGQRLAGRLASWMKEEPGVLFDKLYQAYDRPSSGEHMLFKQRFAHLPVKAAQQLLDHASSFERLRLFTDRRIPMRLAQEARETMEQVLVDRACAELYLPGRGLFHAEFKPFQLLQRLPGWSDDFALELRDGSVHGSLLERIGPQNAAVRRIVVKLDDLHEAFDEAGKTLGPATSGPDSLFDACLRTLPPRQMEALTFFESDRPYGFKLRLSVYEQAIKDRAAVARLLKGQTLEHAETRVFCEQAHPPAAVVTHAHPRTLVRKTRRLFPLFSEAQVSQFLDEQGADHLQRAESIKALEEQLKALRASLKFWKHSPPGAASELQASRRQVADLIENAWRRLAFVRGEGRDTVLGLNLEGMRVGGLPTLPAQVSFRHLRNVSLNNMELDNNVAYFLKSFTHLESLDLGRNKISRLPEILSHMPGLKRLMLPSNGLSLTDYTLGKLANMRNLVTLDLSDNALGGTPDVGKMLDLVNLKLRATGLSELPVGLSRLPKLDFVDLRENVITQLPDWLFEAPRSFAERINLRLNPLSANSVSSINVYRGRTGIGMGFLEDDIAAMNESSARQLWLPALASEKQAIWTDFKDDPRGEALFKLLAELGHSADTEFVHEDQVRRVWEVLEAAHGNAELRDQVFNLAANPINCNDAAATNFSHLEVAVRVHQATEASERGASTSALLREGRSLFRLDQLEKLAHEHSLTDPTADPAEVSLAYRTGLVESLDLPGQPTHMRYARLSGVTGSDLELAAARVRNAELSSQFMDYLVERKFWRAHLHRRYPLRFERMNEPFQGEQAAVLERSHSMPDADFQRQLSDISERRQASEGGLLRTLTQEELKSVDLGCTLTGS
ncbi:NEL-type E3 ubiquitin ligase domain-containing protein [Pseudomonas karstica]